MSHSRRKAASKHRYRTKSPSFRRRFNSHSSRRAPAELQQSSLERSRQQAQLSLSPQRLNFSSTDYQHSSTVDRGMSMRVADSQRRRTTSNNIINNAQFPITITDKFDMENDTMVFNRNIRFPMLKQTSDSKMAVDGRARSGRIHKILPSSDRTPATPPNSPRRLTTNLNSFDSFPWVNATTQRRQYDSSREYAPSTAGPLFDRSSRHLKLRGGNVSLTSTAGSSNERCNKTRFSMEDVKKNARSPFFDHRIAPPTAWSPLSLSTTLSSDCRSANSSIDSSFKTSSLRNRPRSSTPMSNKPRKGWSNATINNLSSIVNPNNRSISPQSYLVDCLPDSADTGKSKSCLLNSGSKGEFYTPPKNQHFNCHTWSNPSKSKPPSDAEQPKREKYGSLPFPKPSFVEKILLSPSVAALSRLPLVLLGQEIISRTLSSNQISKTQPSTSSSSLSLQLSSKHSETSDQHEQWVNIGARTRRSFRSSTTTDKDNTMKSIENSRASSGKNTLLLRGNRSERSSLSSTTASDRSSVETAASILSSTKTANQLDSTAEFPMPNDSANDLKSMGTAREAVAMTNTAKSSPLTNSLLLGQQGKTQTSNTSITQASSNDSIASNVGLASVSSVSAGHSFDLTKKNSKNQVYIHNKLVRLDTKLDKTNATINFNLNVKSNRPILNVELKELQFEGATIWKNPNN